MIILIIVMILSVLISITIIIITMTNVMIVTVITIAIIVDYHSCNHYHYHHCNHYFCYRNYPLTLSLPLSFGFSCSFFLLAVTLQCLGRVFVFPVRLSLKVSSWRYFLFLCISKHKVTDESGVLWSPSAGRHTCLPERIKNRFARGLLSAPRVVMFPRILVPLFYWPG